MTQIFINVFLVLHVLVSLLLLLIVLMQRPKSEGLGAAFGGGMTDNIFGSQTTNVLTRFTVYLGGAFFALTLLLAILYARQTRGVSLLESELLGLEESAPATQSTPAVIEESADPAVVDSEAAVSPEAIATDIEPVSVDLSAPADVEPGLSLEAPAIEEPVMDEAPAVEEVPADEPVVEEGIEPSTEAATPQE